VPIRKTQRGQKTTATNVPLIRDSRPFFVPFVYLCFPLRRSLKISVLSPEHIVEQGSKMEEGFPQIFSGCLTAAMFRQDVTGCSKIGSSLGIRCANVSDAIVIMVYGIALRSHDFGDEAVRILDGACGTVGKSRLAQAPRFDEFGAIGFV
jgi:hypothetical protein